ncbi:MAG TPA: LamG-like jellyroll fold domain-containing protein, partial [Candidatus Sulfotelmatobacter sp.]|nr:LamG-like jellyroll fold domain-containing protein [Candidatus Sulfotelmatobacter sp.]
MNAADTWLFLPGVKPSVVASTLLSQVRVSGAGAVADGNVRVVQYGQNGAVVIPQAASFQPLTVFSQPQFGGTATACGQWTYYTGSGLANISSLKLKRGYQVVFAQSSDGKNWSKCYVAQDGDLEIGVLPTTLDKQVQFIYVTPWRWMPKKGTAGDPGISLLNVGWWYNWNISSSSSRDLEYVAIRQNRWWPGLGQNWKTLGINTVLGYNEPDSTSQANIAVGDALWSWPDLLGTGLRVGSPATTDGGWSSWLYPFIAQADAAGLRVDFVDVHYYRCYDPSNPSGAATQMYNALKGIYDQTRRPLWITEWNNGANWTGCADPTYAQQQACIAAIVDMLENAPFVERYAIYNWVEDVRAVTTNGVLTSAGVTYRDKISNLSYLQAMPDNGTRGIAQFLFATNTCDTSGYYNNGMAVGAPAYTTGHNSQAQAIALEGANSYVQLPANIARGSAFTFAAWVYWNGGANWQRIFDFGNDTSHYLFLTPSSGSGTLRFAINNGSGEQVLERAGALAPGSWQHIAVTLNGNTAILYVNGAQAAASTSFSIAPSAFAPIRNYLGKSQFADPLFNGRLDEVEIADYALTAAQISVLFNSALYPSYTSSVWTNNTSASWGASTNWSSGLIANGVSRMADFSTLNLAADQTVTLDSARTIGGLRFGDASGSQNWTLAGGNTLTLDGGSPNVPTIAVNQNTATLSTPLAGSYGFA